MIRFMIVVGVLMGVVLLFVSGRCSVLRNQNRNRLQDFIQEESAVSPGLREKQFADENNQGGYSDHVEDDEDENGVEMNRYTIT